MAQVPIVFNEALNVSHFARWQCIVLCTRISTWKSSTKLNGKIDSLPRGSNGMCPLSERSTAFLVDPMACALCGAIHVIIHTLLVLKCSAEHVRRVLALFAGSKCLLGHEMPSSSLAPPFFTHRGRPWRKCSTFRTRQGPQKDSLGRMEMEDSHL